MTNRTAWGWTEGDVATDAARIHYYRAGHAEHPTVLLVHGFSDNGLCWRRTAEALADDCDVVMIDARNHGKSSTSAGGLPEMIDDLAAVVRGLSLHQPAVVGHSIGAATAAGVAARYPEIVSRLVLEDPPWREVGDASEIDSQRRRDAVRAYVRSLADMSVDEIAALGLREHPGWGDVERPDWIRSKQQVRVEAADALGSKDWVPDVERLTCPTLLIHGQPDLGGILTPALAEQIATTNPAVSIRGIEAAGHNIRRENFDAFIEALRTFLRG